MAKEPEIGSPEWQRADYVRALTEELDGAKRVSKNAERVKAIEVELARAKKEPRNRRDSDKVEA